MASNKKAQILAAVMCASSIFGSYTVVSAADTPTKIENTNSSVTAGNGTITATAGAQGSQQSTITLGNKSLAINVGKQTTADGTTYGTFTLNSSNLAVSGSTLTMKSSTSSYTAGLTNTGLTIKNDANKTLASLTNTGLTVNNSDGTTKVGGITNTGAITGTGLTVKAVSDTIKPEGNYVESKVTTSGVADTIKQGGFTRATSNVTTNSIKDTIYTDSGTELSSINVFKNTAANGIENGKVSLTAKKIVTDNQTSTTTTTSTLTLGGDNASLKVGNYGFTVDSNNNVLFSGKNASLTSTGLTVNGTGTSSIKSTNTNENSSTVGSYTKNDISYNGMTTTAKGGKYPSDSDNDNKTTSSVTYTGVRDTVYDDSGNIKSTSVVDTNGVTLTSNRYDTGSKISSSLTIKGDSATLTSGTAYVKVDNTVGNVTLSGKNASLTSTGLTVNGTGTSSIKSTNATTEAYTKNDISYNGMTTTARGGKNPSESDNVNKTTSAVTYTGVTDTVYDDGGNLKTKSSVTTSGITNTVNDVSTGKALANSSLTTSGISNTTTDLVMTGTNEGKKMSTALYQNSNGISASATKKDENGTVGTSTLTLAGDSASLKVGNYGFTVDSNNNVLFSGKNASLTSTGLTVNGTGTSSIKSTNATTEAYTKNDISYNGMTTTARGGKNPSESDNVNKTTSAVTYTGVTDTVYDDGGNLKTKSSVTTSGITNTVNDVSTGKALANSSLTTSGISNTTTDLVMTGTNEGKKMSTALYQNSNGISASATKKDENGTVGTSTLTLAGNSASLKVGNYGFAVDSNNNVSIAGNNATLSGSTFTLKDANGKTATLNTSGLTLKDEDGNTTGGISTTGAVTGTSLNITAKNTAGNKTTSTVGATGVTDRVYDTDGKTQVAYSSVGTGGISNTTSLKTTTGKIDTAINQNTSGVGINSTKYDTNNNVTDKTSLTMNGSANNITSIKYNDSNKTEETTSVSVNGGTSSITSYGNYVYGEDGKATSYNQASMSLNGNTGTATIRGGSNTASSTLTLNEAGVALSGKNASLSGSTFTLKDTTNGKTLASLGASGLSINNADGIKVGGISNTGNLIANDGMNVTDKNSSWVNIGTSTMQKDITATTTTSYAGITNKIDTTLAGNKTYTSGTVVGPTSVTTTVQGSTTTDAISGNKNKTTSTVSATGVTDTVYNVKGNQVASSSVTTNGIVNTTTNLSIDGSTNNTMSTSIYQDKRGISASATKKDENGTVGTSTLTLAGNSASLKVGNYGFAVDSNNNVSIAGNNATLSGSTFTLKDANGKTATLNTSGLTLKDEDGNTTGGISSTGAITGTSLRITTSEDTNGNKTVSTVATNGVTDTVTNNKTNNKTTSQVSANGVTDTVYGTDGTTKVASSSVSTSGISNTTSLKTTTGKIDTAINQNTSGVGISSTKYDTNNNVTDKTSVSVNGGTSSITSYGNYVYGEDGKATSYNQASMSLNGNTGIATIRGGSNTASSTLTLNEAGVGLSGKNVSLTSTDLTLKNVETGKAYVKIGSNGLNIYNDEGTSVFGVTRTGAINIDKNVTIDDSYTKDGYTYTASNSISGSNGISNVATKKDEFGKTIATNRSTVTTSGITNSTNISGIAIKDDEYNTKTMSTSIAQNANGVSISSNKYNVYNDGTNTVQTTDGTSTISVNGAKTTISGYGYKYEKDENGKPILDEKGNPIRSSYTNASLSVDGESGIIGLSGKNVGLSANGLTLYKDVEGVKTQYASLTASGLNVNGTGYTIIKSTNATTGAMGQSQLSYNGVTDTVTNAAGNKTTSTVSATGTIDQVYDVDGKTRIAYSNVTTSGITDSFTKDGVTNSVTTNANGTTFASTGNGSTTIKGGAITTNSITVAGNTIDGGFFDTIGQTNGNTAGIVRTEINGDWITSIEGALDISRSGNISLNADKLTYSYNDGKNSGTLGALANKVDDIYDRTQGIDYDKATGTTTIDGNLSVKDETTTGSTGSTGETGTATNNGNITANTANIGGVQIGKNAVTATTGNFDNVAVGGTEGTSISKDGVTVGDKKSDNYTSITNNDVVVNNNGNKTSLTDVGNRVTGLESSVSSMNNRLSDVEDRIDKVGAMSAAIANLRTMGFDPEAPTEIAIGVGQYKSETGLALGVFHYPNQDFMLSASISTSGDEVMGGIGATWKLGRKSAAEKAKDEEARRLEKAEEMKKLAQDAKVKAQAERHAKLLAEREAQKTA